MTKRKIAQRRPQAEPDPPRQSTSIERPKGHITSTTIANFQGPLPPPNILASYDEVIPGLAERIARMAEDHQQHRIVIETLLVRRSTRDNTLGMIFGFVLGIAALSLGGWLAWNGKDAGAISAIVGGLAALLLATWRGTRKND